MFKLQCFGAILRRLVDEIECQKTLLMMEICVMYNTTMEECKGNAKMGLKFECIE